MLDFTSFENFRKLIRENDALKPGNNIIKITKKFLDDEQLNFHRQLSRIQNLLVYRSAVDGSVVHFWSLYQHYLIPDIQVVGTNYKLLYLY